MHREKANVSGGSPKEEGTHPISVISPTVVTPRRVIKSLKAAPACVTQLVQLDGQPQRSLRSSNVAMSMRSDFSVSEVRSELSMADEHPDASLSSFFDRRLRQARVSTCGSTRMPHYPHMRNPRNRAQRNNNNNNNNNTKTNKNNLVQASLEAVEDSAILSYASTPSFYSCESLSSSRSSSTASHSDGYRSMSYTALSESVQSCSLTVLADQVPRHPVGWGRMRRQAPAPQGGRRPSSSFCSIWGDCDADGGRSTGGCSATQGPAGRINHINAAGVRARSAVATVDVPPGTEDMVAPPSRRARKPSSAVVVVTPHPSPPIPEEEAAEEAKEAASGKGKGKEVPLRGTPSPVEDAHTPLSSGCDVTDSPEKEESPYWRVSNVRREERIGRGSYGDVYKGTDLDTGRTIAIKEILVPKDFTKDLEKQLETLEREITVMRKLHHPNTINYLGAQRDDNCLSIYMEYVPGGTIGQGLRADGPLTEDRTKRLTAQLLCGLEYLHARQIVHRDLKGDNLFLGEDDTLKLGDFGTSKELVTTLVTDSVAGTPNFMAPEVIACSGHSYAADIWSVGCCVLEMLTAMPPFAKLDNHMAVMFAVMKGKLEEQVPAHISAGAREFIKACTKHDPKERWTASELREHPWLSGKVKPIVESTSFPASSLLSTSNNISSSIFIKNSAPSVQLDVTVLAAANSEQSLPAVATTKAVVLPSCGSAQSSASLTKGAGRTSKRVSMASNSNGVTSTQNESPTSGSQAMNSPGVYSNKSSVSSRQSKLAKTTPRMTPAGKIELDVLALNGTRHGAMLPPLSPGSERSSASSRGRRVVRRKANHSTTSGSHVTASRAPHDRTPRSNNTSGVSTKPKGPGRQGSVSPQLRAAKSQPQQHQQQHPSSYNGNISQPGRNSGGGNNNGASTSRQSKRHTNINVNNHNNNSLTESPDPSCMPPLPSPPAGAPSNNPRRATRAKTGLVATSRKDPTKRK